MITRFRLLNFKGHLDTVVHLGKLTMLVGDNASGKTSVLEALDLASALAADPGSTSNNRPPLADFLRRESTEGIEFEILVRAAGTEPAERIFRCSVQPNPHNADAKWSEKFGLLSFGASVHYGEWQRTYSIPVGTSRIFHLSASRIAEAAYSSRTDVTIEPDGTNTAVVLAALKLGNDETFERIESALRSLIPSVKRVRLQRATVKQGSNGSVVGNKIHFDFIGAANVPAHCASHGTLIVLALLTILFGPNRPDLILLDDFDHALHPRAQLELVKLIQELLALPEFAKLQIVATTHSPYTLDQLDPDDVQAFALREDGTVACKPLSAHPAAESSKGTLTAGQLWSLDPERDWVLKG
ncbi:MAG: AAA family ATPase [Kofleriaceae bacterium]